MKEGSGAQTYTNYIQQQSVSALENKPKVNITDELRRGLNTELRIKKMGSDVTNPMTAVSGKDTAANTRLDQTRKSLDRTSNQMIGSHDYGSVMSPGSPIKANRGANLATIGYKERNTEAKVKDRRGTTAGRDSSFVNKRSNSV